jgi:hypothetical protein
VEQRTVKVKDQLGQQRPDDALPRLRMERRSFRAKTLLPPPRKLEVLSSMEPVMK